MATVGEILRVAIHYTMPEAGDCMNVFHFRLSGTVGDDDDVKDAVADWINGNWGARWALLACSAATLAYVESDVVATDGTVTRNIGSDILNIAGTVGGEVLPAANAAYILAHTTIPKARGSKYIPGIAEADSVAGALSVGALADLAIMLGFYLAIFTSGGGVTLTPGVLSKTLASFVPFIASGLIDTVVAYQRRRKEGVGI